MKIILLILLFSSPIFSYCQSVDCNYYKNEKDSFNGNIIKELRSKMLCYSSSNSPNDVICEPKHSSWSNNTLNVALKRNGLNKFMVFDYINNVGLDEWILKVKLENGKILTFNNYDQYTRSSMPHVTVKLLTKDILELKKSPLDLIRFEINNKQPNDISSPWDFKITGESKNYLINYLNCLD